MKLSDKTLIKGAELSLENAEELIKEANLLLKNKYYARAYTLFHLSIEEVGKSSILMEACIFGTCSTLSQSNNLLKEIRDHKLKTKRSLRIDYMLASLVKQNSLKKILMNNMYSQGLAINKINDLKNYSLYVSYLNNTFKKPKDIITKTSVNNLKFYAERRFIFLKHFNSMLVNCIDVLKDLAKKPNYKEEIMAKVLSEDDSLINLIDFEKQ